MFCKKHSFDRINNIHERYLSFIQQNDTSDFVILLEDVDEKSINQKYIELLMIEVYKYLNGLSPDIINTIFKLRQDTYNLRNFIIFDRQNPKTKLWFR